MCGFARRCDMNVCRSWEKMEIGKRYGLYVRCSIVVWGRKNDASAIGTWCHGGNVNHGGAKMSGGAHWERTRTCSIMVSNDTEELYSAAMTRIQGTSLGREECDSTETNIKMGGGWRGWNVVKLPSLCPLWTSAVVPHVRLLVILVGVEGP